MTAIATDRTEVPVSTTLTRFLATLATDPDLLAEYLHDKDRVIRESGLSPEDVAALRSGDRSTLMARLDSLVPMPTVQVAITLSTAPGGPGRGHRSGSVPKSFRSIHHHPDIHSLTDRRASRSGRFPSSALRGAGIRSGGDRMSAKDPSSAARSRRRLTHSLLGGDQDRPRCYGASQGNGGSG